MRADHSIVSGARSREMVAQMCDDHMPARFTYRLAGHGLSAVEGTFSVRRCSRDGELSGGVVIDVRIGLFGEGLEPWGYERRLRPGWAQRQLERALSSLFMKAMHEAHRRKRLELLVKLAGEVVPALVSYDEVTLFSSEADVTEYYCDMTYSEITIWETWLRGKLATGRATKEKGTAKDA